MLLSTINILLFILLLTFNSCTKAKNETVDKNYAILGPISSGEVTISALDSNETLFFTKTKQFSSDFTTLEWTKYSVGSFNVDINSSFDAQKWLFVSVTNGEDIDSNDDGIVVLSEIRPLKGTLKLYAKVEDLKNSHIVINLLTTLSAEFYEVAKEHNSTIDIHTFLDDFAQTIFVKSVDSFEGVDYRDLYAYVPNQTSNTLFINPSLYSNLIKNGVANYVLNDENLSAKLLEDSDEDNLSLWQEILHNSSDLLKDTDGDGIDDNREILLGLNPALSDSDHDGLSDKEEHDIYKTDPLNPDSDNDYLPDGVEVQNKTDPNSSDENLNGIADGLDNDPFFKYQWYIQSLGNIVATTTSVATVIGNDLGILNMYHHTVGTLSTKALTVQVIDSGVELSHEDLEVDTALSYNSVTHTNDPSPTAEVIKSDPESPLDGGHGTAVAGILAAKANNGLGIRGIIPHAKIAGSNWLEDETTVELEKVWYSRVNSDKILVSNNSWGAYYLKDEAFEAILKLGSTELREKKGRVYVFASGNFREEFGNSNLSYIANNPYAITVASLNHLDKYATYSTPGSNILVSAYGGEHYYSGPTIMTTSLMGESYYASELNGRKGVITVDEDSGRNYTYAMNGTSSATPMVSGIIALTLDVCPSLTYRDVKWLIAYTATRVDKSNASWVKNAAGLWHSIDYGFGKINGSKMIKTCTSKYYEPLPPLLTKSVELQDINRLIPDNNTTLSTNIQFPYDMKIEWVGLSIDTDHPFAGDLEIALVTPSGTKVSIMTLTETHYAAYDGGFRFGSVAFVDEMSAGTWSVEITDRLKDDSGILKSIKLEVYGHKK